MRPESTLLHELEAKFTGVLIAISVAYSIISYWGAQRTQDFDIIIDSSFTNAEFSR